MGKLRQRQPGPAASPRSPPSSPWKKALFVSWSQQTVETERESRRQFGLSLHEQQLKLKVRASLFPLPHPNPLLHHLLLFLLFLPVSVACSLLWMAVNSETLEETVAPSCFH